MNCPLHQLKGKVVAIILRCTATSQVGAAPNLSYNSTCFYTFKILNLTSVYDSKVAVNIRNIKSQLTTIIEKEWKLELESKPKLRLYKTFKTTFETEGYLYRHLKRQDRSLLAQFRTGVLPLRIETGRYQLKKDPNTESFRKLNVEERTCLIVTQVTLKMRSIFYVNAVHMRSQDIICIT